MTDNTAMVLITLIYVVGIVAIFFVGARRISKDSKDLEDDK